MSHQNHSFKPDDRHTQTHRADPGFSHIYTHRRSLILSFGIIVTLRRWGQCPVQSRPNRKSRPFVKKCIFHCFLMQNMCNTNSRILIQQSDKFIFLGILVLGLHPAPDYACGVWTYKLPHRHTTREAVYTSHKTATELDINLAPDYWLRWVHILHVLFGTNFVLIIINTFILILR